MNNFIEYKYIGRGSSRAVYTDGIVAKKICVEDRVALIYEIFSEPEYWDDDLEPFLYECNLKELIEFFNIKSRLVKPRIEKTQDMIDKIISFAESSKEGLFKIINHINGINQQIYEFENYELFKNCEIHGTVLSDVLIEIYDLILENDLPVMFCELGTQLDIDEKEQESEYFSMRGFFFNVPQDVIRNDFHEENFVYVNGKLKLCDFGYPSVGLY